MKRITKLIILLMMLTAGLFNSCKDTLDLDEDTLLLIDKQEKLEKLDELFDLSFADPFKAEIDYRQFLREELLTETQNYLVDMDISNRNSMTDLAIRLNTNAEKIKDITANSLFEWYRLKFENQMLSQSLYGELPQQLKRGERIVKFQNKLQEVQQFFEEKIQTFRNTSIVDQSIINKTWNLQTLVFKFTPAFKIYNVNFQFQLKADKSMDIESFFFMPHIPKSGTLLGIMEEVGFFKEEISPSIESAYEYAIYDNKICFYFRFKNDYDFLDETGKLAREWCYEYAYHIEDGKLVLTEPRILFNMPPVIRITGYEDPVFQEEYPDELKRLELSEL